MQPVIASREIPRGSLIRDAETEQFINKYLEKILRAADLDPSQVRLYLLMDNTVNALATSDHKIIVFTGLIEAADDVGELMGVLAHETGHIAGGHHVKLQGALDSLKVPMIASVLLGGLAGVAAGRSDVAAGATLGAAEIGRRAILSHTRAHESSADQAAVKYLKSVGWSSDGLIKFMELLHSQSLGTVYDLDTYVMTHPALTERLEFFRNQTATQANPSKPYPKKMQQEYDRVRAKIIAYSTPPGRLANHYQPSDNSTPARYARAIADHRSHNYDQALAAMDKLIAENPNDPFFHEFRGQILFETGRIPEAVASYKQAVKLAAKKDILRIILAGAVLEQGTPSASKEAIETLQKVGKRERESPLYWRLMATAYGRDGQEGMAALMVAEQLQRSGQERRAKNMAEQALQKLPATQQEARQRADDILHDIAVG